ncbi:hypothetical protein ACFVTX_18235 [Agromyces sp. NPDC058136]|uniref:hypothetical protein n=1 Tax=Agromyces sp. NPDC058136 TaxID=3346354 RepID=UPI0036D80182
MTTEADVLLRLIGASSTVKPVAGTYQGLDGLRALVQFDGGRVPAHFMTAWMPVLGDTVWVVVIDGVAYLLGPSAPRPADGTVVSVSAGIATVSTEIGNVPATYTGTAPSAGQQVKLLASGGFHIIGVKSTSPAPPPVVPGGGSGTAERTEVFYAVDAGSYQSRWWQDQVWASDGNWGAWFYGDKIWQTVPASAVGLSLEIYLPVVQLQGSPPRFGMHPWQQKAVSGTPTDGSYSGTTPIGVGGSGWAALPTSWIDSLKYGGGQNGVGLVHGGYNKFASLGADGQSGALRIKYRA